MQFRTAFIGIVAVASAVSVGSAFAADGNVAAGKSKASVCEVCHGLDGRGTAPNFPALAGQHQEYLEQALHEFKDGKRTNAIMNAMAMPLTDQDIDNLAAYFAGLPCDPPSSREGNSGGN